MKYINILILIFLMSWSWGAIQKPQPISEYIHLGIQEDLKRIIADYIQKHLSTARNLQFERMWSENINPDQVKATFIYSFEDETEEVGAARVQIEGYAILNHELTTNENEDHWSFDELYISDNSVEFKEGLKIASPKNNE